VVALDVPDALVYTYTMTTKYYVQLVRKGKTLAECDDDLVSVVDGSPVAYIHADSPAQAAVAAALALGLTTWDHEVGEWVGSENAIQPTKVDVLYISRVR
jgi:hypothetical protein